MRKNSSETAEKIVVDLRSLDTPSGKRGIGYFTYNLFAELLKVSHPKFNLILLTTLKSQTPKRLTLPENDIFYSVPTLFRPLRGVRRLDPIFAQVWRRLVKNISPDLVHITSLFDIYYQEIPKNVKSIVSLYDLIPLVYKDRYFKNAKALDWYLNRFDQLKQVDKIITISKSAKQDIVKFLKIPESKVAVVYGGIDNRFKKTSLRNTKITLAKYRVRKPYIMALGAFSFHKNIPSLFEAFARFSKLYHQDLDLVVVCKLIPQEEKIWRQQLRSLNIEERVHLTNFVPDEDLPALYSGAKLFVFPSLYEGFGLPILEAMSCEVPVVTSKTSSMPEAGGKAAFYVDPLKVDEIVKGMERVLTDQKLQDKMIRLGKKQVKKFSWEKSAVQTLQVYREVLAIKK